MRPNCAGRDKAQRIYCGYPSMSRTGATWTNSQASISAQRGTLADLEILFGSRYAYGLGRHEISFVAQIRQDSATRKLDRRTRDRERWNLVCFYSLFRALRRRIPGSSASSSRFPYLWDWGLKASGCRPDDRSPASLALRPDHLSLHSSPRDHKVVSSTVAFSVCPRCSSNFS